MASAMLGAVSDILPCCRHTDGIGGTDAGKALLATE